MRTIFTDWRHTTVAEAIEHGRDIQARHPGRWEMGPRWPGCRQYLDADGGVRISIMFYGDHCDMMTRIEVDGVDLIVEGDTAVQQVCRADDPISIGELADGLGLPDELWFPDIHIPRPIHDDRDPGEMTPFDCCREMDGAGSILLMRSRPFAHEPDTLEWRCDDWSVVMQADETLADFHRNAVRHLRHHLAHRSQDIPPRTTGGDQ